MLEETLAGLASAGGTALVGAMVTDGWEGVKARFARFMGRGDARKTEAAAARLGESQALLVALTGSDLQRAQAEEEVVWRTRLGDLLESQPEAGHELSAIVAEVRARAAGSAVRVEQRVTGSGGAQQAVQGHGVQVNTFGGRDEPVTGR